MVERRTSARDISVKICKKKCITGIKGGNTLYSYIDEGKRIDIPCTKNIE
jgi:hypothetical protein